jgi:23S rRNA-/tRNA-specific pseudouridylate synthase
MYPAWGLLRSGMTYLRGMEKKIVPEASSLLEFLMGTGFFATNTQARKWIKSGRVQVNAIPVKIPSSQLSAGDAVSWGGAEEKGSAVTRPTRTKDFQLGSPAPKPAEVPPPFEVVYEDAFVLAYIKPAGWVFASPNPQVRTSYSQMKDWMSRERPQETDVHFVNRIEKESSGICLIAKDIRWRTHLQLHWNKLEKGLYVLVEGHLPADSEIQALEPAVGGGKKGAMRTLPYRTMRATEVHTLLKFEMGLDEVPLLMAALRRAGCTIVGKGAAAPDPMGRSGMHLYRVVLEGPGGERVEIKSRVPKDFLSLMKGGKGPKAVPAFKREAAKAAPSGPASKGRAERPQRTESKRTESKRTESERTERKRRVSGNATAPRSKGRDGDAPRRFSAPPSR